MILVFTEFNGERVLGKARELAEALGRKVVAISAGDHDSAQKLVHLGADEVLLHSNPESVFDWTEILSSFLNEKTPSFLLGGSGILTDSIFGRVYAISKAKVGAFATGMDTMNETLATKIMRSWNSTLAFSVESLNGKSNIFSLKVASIPEPFEDTSRYGKISERSFTRTNESDSPKFTVKNDDVDESGVLSLMLGKELAQEPKGEARRAIELLVKKYNAKLVEEEWSEIYGNCVAFGVETTNQKEFPEFHGELIALVRSDLAAITRVASTTYLTNEISAVIESI